MRLHVARCKLLFSGATADILPLKPKGSDIQMAKYKTEIEEI